MGDWELCQIHMLEGFGVGDRLVAMQLGIGITMNYSHLIGYNGLYADYKEYVLYCESFRMQMEKIYGVVWWERCL